MSSAPYNLVSRVIISPLFNCLVWLVVWCHPWIKRDCVGTVMFLLKLSFLFSNFYQIYYFYDHEKLMVDKLASLTPADKSLPLFVCWFLRTWQTKFFDISIEWIKSDEILGPNIFRKLSAICIFLKSSIYFHMSLEIDFFVQVNQLSITHFSL